MDNNMECENIFDIIHTQYHKLKDERDELQRIVNENKIEIVKLRKENKQLKEENEAISDECSEHFVNHNFALDEIDERVSEPQMIDFYKSR